MAKIKWLIVSLTDDQLVRIEKKESVNLTVLATASGLEDARKTLASGGHRSADSVAVLEIAARYKISPVAPVMNVEPIK